MKKTIKQPILLLLLGLFLTMPALAQEEHEKEEEPGWETVFSVLSIYNTENKASDLATEVHLTYWATHKWAFGVGYTFIFEEDNRIGHEVAALVSHKPWSFLTVNAGPSFSLPNSHKDTEVSAYLETEFAFKLGAFHAGPTIGNLIGEEYRVFGGLHISYEF
jgi:hypothetical protein